MKYWHIVLTLLVIVVVASGLSRLRLDADVFSLLPADSPTVNGLQLFQNNFGSSQAIIVSVRTPDAGTTKRATETLAQQLQSAGLAKQVIWRSPFQSDPQSLSEFLAYLWYNQPPVDFKAMAQRFDDGQLRETLAQTIERMGTSLNPQEVARLAHDPFSLATIGNTIPTSLINMGKNQFASKDGRIHILYVSFPGDEPGFWQYRDWLDRINNLVSDWQQSDEAAQQSTVRITGNPVFITGFGSRLLKDMSLAAAGTLIVIAILFWWAHRRWAPLLWLILLLMMTVTITMALGGFLFGTLNAVSLGFAAILMGLAVDYGLILYQERRTYPERSASELRRVMAPSILWAAVTTAGAFALVSRSSLPGLAQLGTLVAIGIISAAVLMLTVYVALFGRSVAQAKDQQELPVQSNDPGLFNGNRVFIWSTTLLLLVLSSLILFNRGPGVQSGVAALQFEDVQARTTLQEIQREITGFASESWLIITGSDEREVGTRLANAELVLARGKQNGLLTRVALPTGLWPQADAQRGNRETARALVQRLSALQEAALVAGFTSDSLQLTKAIFEVWSQFTDLDTVAWPQQPASRWLFSQFAANDEERMLALGQIEVAPEVSSAQVVTLADELAAANGGQLVGWSLLADSLLATMKHDITRVVLPMAVALVVLLGFAYRDVREIILSFATLAFTLLCLNAAMSVFNWSWNLMNMIALPLLLGAGVDYSIHVQLALKRYVGDITRVKRSVGNAILLCGASTAAAFASLGFASNPGLASLGQVAALGIVIASLTAVFLLPVWWSTAQGRNRLKRAGE